MAAELATRPEVLMTSGLGPDARGGRGLIGTPVPSHGAPRSAVDGGGGPSALCRCRAKSHCYLAVGQPQPINRREPAPRGEGAHRRWGLAFRTSDSPAVGAR